MGKNEQKAAPKIEPGGYKGFYPRGFGPIFLAFQDTESNKGNLLKSKVETIINGIINDKPGENVNKEAFEEAYLKLYNLKTNLSAQDAMVIDEVIDALTKLADEKKLTIPNTEI